MSDFADKLSGLVAREAAASRGDPERFGAMIERLSASLGFTVALACRGHGPAIDEMLAGAEAYAHAEAVEKAPFAQLMASTRQDPTNG